MTKNDDHEAKAFRRPGNSDSPQLMAVKDLLNAYCTLDTGKVDALLPETYLFFALPKNKDVPPEDKRDHLERWSKLFVKLKSIEYKIYETFEVPVNDKIILHYSVVCKPINGDELEYDALSIFTLEKVTRKEYKVERSQNFSDPEKRKNLHGLVSP